MASDAVFEANDKRKLRLTPSGEEGMEAFRRALRPEEMEALTAMRNSEPTLCEPWNDAFVMRFLWARKLDVPRAIELFKNHLQWREEFSIDEGVDLEAVKAYFKQGGSLWAPGHYTKQGYSASYILLKHFDPESFNKLGMRGLLHASYFALDLSLDHDMDIARRGTIIIEDLSGASFMDLMRMMKGESSLDFKKMMDSMQNHLPSRMGGIILVNAPWYVRVLTTLAKPMLKPKLRKKIIMCSTSELDQYFSPEQLPTLFGGQFEVNHDWLDELLEARPHLSEGKYVDPSPKSEAFLETITGTHPVLSVSELAASKKSKKKASKSKKKSETDSD